jgi:hypothetical protein
MHREPGILTRAYAKTVKLNPVKPTQERSVEKPRAAAPALFDSRRAAGRDARATRGSKTLIYNFCRLFGKIKISVFACFFAQT